jgi:hypothetical protein
VQTERSLHRSLAKSQKEEKQDDEMMCTMSGIMHQSENIYNSILHIKLYFVEFGY